MQQNNKALIITIAVILVAAFFMPWIKFFVSVSPWDILFGDADRALNIDFKYIILLIPISGIIIFFSTAFNNENSPIPKTILFLTPILTLITIAFVLAVNLSNNGGGNFKPSDLDQ